MINFQFYINEEFYEEFKLDILVDEIMVKNKIPTLKEKNNSNEISKIRVQKDTEASKNKEPVRLEKTRYSNVLEDLLLQESSSVNLHIFFLFYRNLVKTF